MVYEYLYVEITIGLFDGDDYTKIIEQHIQEGWRFVTSIPKSSGAFGQLIKRDLVFEKLKFES